MKIHNICNLQFLFSLGPKLNTKLGLHTTTTTQHQSNFQVTTRHTRRLRFGMLTKLTNIRSSKVLWQDGHSPQDCHHPNITFSTVQLLELFQVWQEAKIWYVDFIHKNKIIQGVVVGWSTSLGQSPSLEQSPSLGWSPSKKQFQTNIFFSDKRFFQTKISFDKK